MRGAIALFRSLAGALALGTALLVVTPLVAACTTSQVQAVTPNTPRQALAVAEISLVGAATVAVSLYENGVIDRDTAVALADSLETLGGRLDQARLLLTIGESAAAAALIVAAQRDIDDTAVDLSARAEAARVRRTPT